MSPDAQRMRALDRANEIRKQRKQLKQRIAVREVDARELLTSGVPDYAETMKLSTLLESVPKVGRVKAQKIIRRTVQRDLPLDRISPVSAHRIAELLPS